MVSSDLDDDGFLVRFQRYRPESQLQSRNYSPSPSTTRLITGNGPPAISRLEVVQSILATLQREKLPPTYGFINGVKTEEHSDGLSILRAWRAAGQPLANHTWSDPDFNDKTSEQCIANIEANQPLLRTLMSAPSDGWHWLRFPYLNEGNTLEKHREVRTWLKDNHYRVAEVSFEDQRYRASGLNLVFAAITLWNIVYLERAVAALRAHGITIHDESLAHLSPIGWEHINLTGDYTWHATSRLRKGAFRPLRPFAASNE